MKFAVGKIYRDNFLKDYPERVIKITKKWKSDIWGWGYIFKVLKGDTKTIVNYFFENSTLARNLKPIPKIKAKLYE
jgi:hypothetical protein